MKSVCWVALSCGSTTSVETLLRLFKIFLLIAFKSYVSQLLPDII